MTYPDIKSSLIERATQAAVSHGNAILEVSEGWSKMNQVVHMRSPLTAELKLAISSIATLRYWLSPPTPHNASEEGFTDDGERVAIAFPQSAE